MRKLMTLFIAMFGLYFVVGFTEVEYSADFSNINSIYEEVVYTYDDDDEDYIDVLIEEAEEQGYFVYKSMEGDSDQVTFTSNFTTVDVYVYYSYFIYYLSSSYANASTSSDLAVIDLTLSLPDEIDELEFSYILDTGVQSYNSDKVSSGVFTWDLDYDDSTKDVVFEFEYDSGTSFFSNLFSKFNFSFELIFIICLVIGLIIFGLWMMSMHALNNRV